MTKGQWLTNYRNMNHGATLNVCLEAWERLGADSPEHKAHRALNARRAILEAHDLGLERLMDLENALRRIKRLATTAIENGDYPQHTTELLGKMRQEAADALYDGIGSP